ncbi:MAG: hypothetical protein ACHQRJ_13365 [Alphaproteobacteria bacterium]
MQAQYGPALRTIRWHFKWIILPPLVFFVGTVIYAIGTAIWEALFGR